MAKVKVFKIEKSKSGRAYTPSIGTLDELIQDFEYTLEVGQSWEHEKGNKKINRKPKGIKSLVTNLYNAKNNAAANGWSGFSYSEGVLTQKELETYLAEKNAK